MSGLGPINCSRGNPLAAMMVYSLWKITAVFLASFICAILGSPEIVLTQSRYKEIDVMNGGTINGTVKVSNRSEWRSRRTH